MIKFGTGGFRGIIGDDFTKDHIQLIAQAISNIINKGAYKKLVAMGYDYRFLSSEAATWMCEVFAGNSIEVLLTNEPVPTPAIMYITKDLKNDFGVMITASHNPYLFNGIKVFQKDGMDADVNTTQNIENELNNIISIKSVSSNSKVYSKLIKTTNFNDQYINYIKKFISPSIKNSNIKVLYDGFYGVGEKTIKKAIQEYNLNNIDLQNCSHDAFFGGFDPNPNKYNMLKNKNKVLEGNYSYAFGMDSDGDRLGIIDENGNYVDSNEILSCLYYYLVKYRNEKGDCVKNIATSILFDKVANKLGYNCHEVDVGFKNISSKMKETNALIGGESSGGLTIRNYLFGKDSTFSALLFLEMVVVMKKKVSEIVKEVKDYANYNYLFDEGVIKYDKSLNIYNILNKSMPKFKNNPLKTEKVNNNIKYHFENNKWVLLRISGTEPALRTFIEMSSEEEVKEYKEILNDYIQEINKQPA